MATLRLTKTAIDALEPGQKDQLWWDTELTGFGLKVTPKGRKVYIVDYRLPGRRKTGRYTIGRHGSPWTPTEARKTAAQVRLGASQGVDPNADKRQRRAETVDYGFTAYADRFVDAYLRRNWVGSHDRGESVLRRHAKPFFKNRDIREITKRDCAMFMDSLKHVEATARKAAEVVGKMFRWAEDRGDVARSPMDRVPRPKPSPGRERVLTSEELADVWRAASNLSHPFGALVKMLMLTGQRRGEVGGMRWEEWRVQDERWELPKARTKSGRPHVTPLTPMMVELLADQPRLGELVFTCSGDRELGNHSKLKLKLDQGIAKLRASEAETMPHWTLHDLRRTAATVMESKGFDHKLIDLTQGRAKKLGASDRYLRYDHLAERKRALLAWNAHIRDALEARGAASSHNLSPTVEK